MLLSNEALVIHVCVRRSFRGKVGALQDAEAHRRSRQHGGFRKASSPQQPRGKREATDPALLRTHPNRNAQRRALQRLIISLSLAVALASIAHFHALAYSLK